MKQIKTKSGEILIAEVPEVPEKFTIKAYGFAGTWLEEVQNENFNLWKTFLNKSSNQMYSVLGKLSELTDKDCEEFVELTPTGLFKLYSWLEEKVDNLGIQPITNFAKESFISLLQSESIDTSNEDKLLIIKML